MLPRRAGLVVCLGANPAPLLELAWALSKSEAALVERATVLVTERARKYLESEVLAPGAALDDLHRVLGPEVLPRAGIEVRNLVGVDDESEAYAAALGDALWVAAKEATRRPEPVVFALAGGRRHATTAAMTTVFSLLARRRDRCFAVRVSDRAAEGGSGFYFPGQSRRMVPLPGGGVLDASTVQVRLEEVQLPRLRRLLADLRGDSFAQAVMLGQRSLDALSPPELVVNLAEGSLSIGGIELERGTARVLWLATLAQARLDDPDPEGGWVASDQMGPFQDLVERCASTEWIGDVRHRLVRFLRGQEFPGFTLDRAGFIALGTLRNQSRTAILRFVRKHYRQHEHLLVPEATKSHASGEQVYRQRLALPADLIRIIDPAM
jgi:CRISPR-associated protein (TIGR02584 family)